MEQTRIREDKKMKNRMSAPDLADSRRALHPSEQNTHSSRVCGILPKLIRCWAKKILKIEITHSSSMT